MKKMLFFLFFIGIVVQATAIDASILHSTFKGPTKNYVELHLHIVGSSIHYKTIDDYPRGGVEVLILFKRGEEILKFDKFTLNSTQLPTDTAFVPRDFGKLSRYALEDGEYRLEVTLKDIYKEDNIKKHSEALFLSYENDKVQLSDLQAIEVVRTAKEGESNDFIKNGYYLEPHPFGFYSRFYDNLQFYTEVYNADKVLKDDYFVRYFVEGAGSNNTPLQMSYKRLKAETVSVLVLQLNIAKIPSGNYNLVLEVRNRDNQLITSKKMYFQRSNPYLEVEVSNYKDMVFEENFVNTLDDKQVKYSIRALSAIAEGLEVEEMNAVLKSDDASLKRQFLFGFWVSRNANKPKEAFIEYMKRAHAVDKKFASTLRRGFETDRGRVYLKYGPPNDIIQELSEPTAPPYEIWEYNSLKNQQNVKFIFANQSLVANDYKLLHSNLFGEINNPQWQLQLYKNSPIKSGNYLDGTVAPTGIGNNANSRFNN